MRALIVENFPDTHAGLVGAALRERGADITILRPHDGDALPTTTADLDAMVVLGGAQDALDDTASPYLPRLVELIRERATRDAPLLGICLGAQLIARALGGDNLIGGHLEFGYCDVTPLTDATTDPLFADIAGPVTTFQWHTDAATLPPGAVGLMTSPLTDVQAFRVGRNVYATQFHFEATDAMARTWIGKAGDWLDAHVADWRDRVAAFPDKAPAAEAFGLALARRWVASLD